MGEMSIIYLSHFADSASRAISRLTTFSEIWAWGMGNGGRGNQNWRIEAI